MIIEKTHGISFKDIFKRIIVLNKNLGWIIIVVRIIALLSIGVYMATFYLQLYDRDFDHELSLLRRSMRYFAYGLICNFGLFFITTNVAKRHRILSTLLYLPTVFISPAFNTFILGYETAVILFIGSIAVYFKFNPWVKGKCLK